MVNPKDLQDADRARMRALSAEHLLKCITERCEVIEHQIDSQKKLTKVPDGLWFAALAENAYTIREMVQALKDKTA